MNVASPSPTTAEVDGAPGAERLEELFAGHQAELLGTLFCLVGNVEDARDALQETFVKCWRRRQSLHEIDNLRAWVFQVALNTGRDLRKTAWRRRRQPSPEIEPMLISREPGPASHLEQQEQLQMLRQALGDLRPEEQEVFLLRQNGHLTYEQIAVAIDIPLGTVKTRMRLALSKLRAVLAE